IRLLAVIFLWSSGGVLYLFFDVFRNRDSLMALGDSLRTQKLLAKKESLKSRLDNPSLRRELREMQLALFEALLTGSEAATKKIFQDMKGLSQAEASRLGLWFVDQRKAYEDEDGGARMQKLSTIPSEQRGQAVQPPLEDSYARSSDLAVNALSAKASWLRRDFSRQLSDMVKALNDIKLEDVRKFDEKLKLDPSTHKLQPEAGAVEHGKHLGLLVASVKSKERALAKVNTDYQEDFETGTKTEQPLARYVCDFLRATIYASDPFALAIAFHAFQERFNTKIVRVKNKFADSEPKLKDEERTNILVNLWVEAGNMRQIGEVQFLLQEYLTAKSLQHLYYDVARAKAASELFDKPIFD
ncbi:unnamed protein product, partial [Symbiodinium pilosum]